MSSSLDPVEQVRATCSAVVEGTCALASAHVKISDEAILTLARSLASEDLQEFRNGVDWDACGWHYSADAKLCGPKTCQYIFVMDSLNFCFWPTEGLEYDALASRLRDVLIENPAAFNAEALMNIDAVTLSSWFPEHQLPQLEERLRRLRELGEALQNDFDGLAANIVREANHSAVRLVTLVLRYLPGFRDTIVYKGRLIHFYKRAQILVGDLWAAYGRPTDPSHPYHFNDIDKLTMFADYRVPQILRAMNVLQYSETLAKTIDFYEEIAFGSDMETEIRACTVIAVERLQRILAEQGLNLLVLEVDWLLWQKGEAIKDTIKPHHRTLTIYY